MPVKYFVSKDSQGRQWPPDTSGESKEVVEIIKRVYSAYNDSEHLYAIVANLHIPDAYADLVVITDRGMGFIELKGNYGKIYQQGVYWYAGNCTEPIKAGSQNTPARNPHEQVRAYAATIRKKLLTPLLGIPWLPGNSDDWKKFKFSTAVCFTNRQADIEEFKHTYCPRKLEWENYADIILAPADIPDWVDDLRFEVQQGYDHNYEPYTIQPNQIMRIITYLLNATEWTEITPRMPTSSAYAYLALIEDGKVIHTFHLERDSILVGRGSPTLSISNRYSNVSREHTLLTRSLEGVFIKDLDSKYGTYINGKRLYNEKRLTHGQRITLGGSKASNSICLFEFSLEQPTSPETI